MRKSLLDSYADPRILAQRKQAISRERQTWSLRSLPLVFLTEEINHCYSYVIGPVGTPYEGGLYAISVRFPVYYPMTAPRVRFETPISHPSVNQQGEVSRDILKAWWSAGPTVAQVRQKLEQLLSTPNPLSWALAEQGKVKYAW